MRFKLNEQVVVCHDGKWRPLSWNSRSVLGIVTKIKNRKQVRIKFEYCDEILELWFKYKTKPYSDGKDFYYNGCFTYYFSAVKLDVFNKKMSDYYTADQLNETPKQSMGVQECVKALRNVILEQNHDTKI